MLPIANVQIDDDVLIRCPIKDFQYRKASIVCPQCAGFHGIAQMVNFNGKGTKEDFDKEFNLIPWDGKYAIRCGAMIERLTKIIQVVD
ncbi:MAG: hypothetical protein JRJ45_12990 [Deltaproteobacteria bacterium]|nr:hypothetical protein [Deltaproteobacteria bacterium]